MIQHRLCGEEGKLYCGGVSTGAVLHMPQMSILCNIDEARLLIASRRLCPAQQKETLVQTGKNVR